MSNGPKLLMDIDFTEGMPQCAECGSTGRLSIHSDGWSWNPTCEHAVHGPARKSARKPETKNTHLQKGE